MTIMDMAMIAAKRDILQETRSRVSALEAEVAALRAENKALIDEKLTRQAKESQAASDDAWAVWGSE